MWQQAHELLLGKGRQDPVAPGKLRRYGEYSQLLSARVGEPFVLGCYSIWLGNELQEDDVSYPFAVACQHSRCASWSLSHFSCAYIFSETILYIDNPVIPAYALRHSAQVSQQVLPLCWHFLIKGDGQNANFSAENS